MTLLYPLIIYPWLTDDDLLIYCHRVNRSGYKIFDTGFHGSVGRQSLITNSNFVLWNHWFSWSKHRDMGNWYLLCVGDAETRMELQGFPGRYLATSLLYWAETWPSTPKVTVRARNRTKFVPPILHVVARLMLLVASLEAKVSKWLGTLQPTVMKKLSEIPQRRR